MKPTVDLLEVESTLVGEDIAMEMSSDAADQSHLQSIFIDMYENRPLAVVREYWTNAFDAHVEAGVTQPVEVNLPSALSPSLRIRDFGPGLDVTDIRELYSQYGKSTKRGTNKATGMLGIGCKSALTYSDQFTVVSVKDGRRVVVSVSRNEDGGGTMKVLEDAPSPDASGVEIIVGVRKGDYNDFDDAAVHLLQFAPKGSVLLNGVEPEHISESAYRLNDDLFVVEDEPNDWVVMGNVPYPADLEIYSRHSNYRGGSDGRAIVAFVEIGSVHFTPAREALQDTQRTKDRLEQIKADFATESTTAVTRDVSAATTKPEAFRAYWDSCAALELGGNMPDVRFNGETVPTHIKYKDVPAEAPVQSTGYRYRSNYRRNSDDIHTYEMRVLPENSGYGRGNENTVKSRLDADDMEDSILWITDFAPTTYSKAQRTRIDAYKAHKNLSNHRAVLVKRAKPPMEDWQGTTNVVSWKDLRKWKDPNATVNTSTGPRKVAGTYYVRTYNDNYGIEKNAKDLPSEALYWIEGRKHAGHEQMVRLGRLVDDAMLVVLPQNRVAKFERDFPHAVPYHDAMECLTWHAWEKISDRNKLIWQWSGTAYDQYLEGLDGVDDPDLAAVCAAAKEKERQTIDLPTSGDRDIFVMPKSKLDIITDEEIEKRYPLLADFPSYMTIKKQAKQHLVLYLNAAYAAHKKGDT